ncbi:hypothetical protein R1sor_026808 [Riccia sorocarpa]|uniref:Uncharacterized protein n=1 Tax=Riccia sorocarpa TaxID=122646 RepID=A0ABD3GCI3_9MARC
MSGVRNHILIPRHILYELQLAARLLSDGRELVASPRPSRIRNSQEDPLQRGIQALDAGRIVLEKAVELKSEDDEVWVNDASLEALVDEFETYHGVTHNGRAPENGGKLLKRDSDSD